MKKQLLTTFIAILFLLGCVGQTAQIKAIEPEKDSFDAPARAESNTLKVKRALEKKHSEVIVENWFGYSDDD